MKIQLLAFLALYCLLLVGSPRGVVAQSSTADANSYIPWFTVKNNAMMVQTGSKVKPLTKDVTLPNGILVEYRTKSILLTTGTRVPLNEGDMLSLNGEFIRKTSALVTIPVALPAPALTPAAAVATAPVALTPAVVVPVPSAPVAFGYRPAAPVNGRLKGVVELGASGFNLFIIQVDGQHNWKLEKSEFGNSLVMENMATEADIRNGLKAYIGKMLDFGVAGRDIHFVVSSGAALSEKARSIVKSLQALNYQVTTVTPEREGVLGLRAALPPVFADKAFVVDMGSANTKIAWLANGQSQVADTYGSKYFEKNAADADVAAAVRAKAAQVPASLRGTCFIIGGVPFELAKAGRQGQEPYTVLRAADAYPQLSGAKIKSGLNIYQAITAATGCQQFVFGYDANFTIGYLLSLP